jgi:transposase
MNDLWPQSLPAVFPAVLPVLRGLRFQPIVEARIGKRWDNGVAHSDVLTVLLLMILDQGRLRPLSQVHEWAQQFGIEVLLGVSPAQLHDDKIGYTLDALVPVGADGEPDLSVIQSLEHQLVHEAICGYGIATDRLHYDFTDVSFSGVYDDSELVRRGKGPGRRQFELALNVAADSGFPVRSQAHPGATSHMRSAPGNLEALQQRLPGQRFCVLADSGAVCYDNIVAYEQAEQHFIGPRQLQPHEQQALAALACEQFVLAGYTGAGGGRYWVHEQREELSPRHKQDTVSVRSIAVISETKRRDQQDHACRHMLALCARLEAIAGYAGSRANYRKPEYVRTMAEKALSKYAHAGRFVSIEVGPEPSLSWSVDWAGFADYRQRLGRYRLYTNLPAEDCPADEVLELYHGRHVVERAYRQLKSHLMIAPMHLHKDNRLYALTWVYVVALMVLSLLQLLARRAGLTTKRKYPLTARALLAELQAVDALATRRAGRLYASVAPLPPRAQHYLNALGFPDAQTWLAVPPCDHAAISRK